MKHELESKLIADFPQLFADVTKPPTESLMCFGCECNDGWYGLIRKVCEQITEALSKNQNIGNLRFVQIKEKWGQLRIYVNNYPNEIEEILNNAEAESANICEMCGTTENVTQNSAGWIKSLCPTCRENRFK